MVRNNCIVLYLCDGILSILLITYYTFLVINHIWLISVHGPMRGSTRDETTHWKNLES